MEVEIKDIATLCAFISILIIMLAMFWSAIKMSKS